MDLQLELKKVLINDSSQPYHKKGRHIGMYVHGITFSVGGIERLACQLANFFNEQKWKVTIYTSISMEGNGNCVYPVHDNVGIKRVIDLSNLEKSSGLLSNELVKDDVDIFVPMLSEWLFEPIVTASKKAGVYTIVSEHNDPDKIEELWWNRESRLSTFSKADRIHLILDVFRESLPASLQEKIFVIPNGIVPPAISIDTILNPSIRKNIIISVGRLAPQKKHAVLISAVAKIQQIVRVHRFAVHIYGEGHLRALLQEQIDESGVADIVVLKGVCHNLSPQYLQSMFMVHPAEFEGFGLVLVEALSHGLPIILNHACNKKVRFAQPHTGDEFSSVSTLASLLTQWIQNPKDVNAKRESCVNAATAFTIDKCCEMWKNLIEDSFLQLEDLKKKTLQSEHFPESDLCAEVSLAFNHSSNVIMADKDIDIRCQS